MTQTRADGLVIDLRVGRARVNFTRCDGLRHLNGFHLWGEPKGFVVYEN
ncbi:hypothetical protein Y048_6007 [Burkholderia pseudomallei MSHR456]|nr:hypothetical protein Y048_6007 [Burkholderia pseudomallei MSHR456]